MKNRLGRVLAFSYSCKLIINLPRCFCSSVSVYYNVILCTLGLKQGMRTAGKRFLFGISSFQMAFCVVIPRRVDVLMKFHGEIINLPVTVRFPRVQNRGDKLNLSWQKNISENAINKKKKKTKNKTTIRVIIMTLSEISVC